MEKLKTDQMWLGLVLGVLLPSVTFGLLYLIARVCAPAGKPLLIPLSTVLLVAIFTNLFTMRYYLVKLKFDRTGRGILLVTCVLAIAYFLLFDQLK